jgi:hypothetical protein
MRILKTEVGSMHENEPAADAKPAAPFTQPELTAAPAPAPAPAQQDQIDVLQQQIRDLQRAATMDPAPAGVPAEPQRTQQPS